MGGTEARRAFEGVHWSVKSVHQILAIEQPKLSPQDQLDLASDFKRQRDSLWSRCDGEHRSCRGLRMQTCH
jgi:hypothetical protein